MARDPALIPEVRPQSHRNDTIGLLKAMTAPSQIAHYKVTGKLGEGGMGVAYRATDTRLNRDVGIRVSTEPLGKYFEREARSIAALNHPNIRALYDVARRRASAVQGPLAIAPSGVLLSVTDRKP
jgi:serine/threonine protein kinase